MNTSIIDSFRKDLREATRSLEEKYGVKIDLGTSSYNETEFRFKTTVTKVGTSTPSKLSGNNVWTVGMVVGINHRKVDKNKKFTITKINAKSITVEEVNGVWRAKVTPSLLVKI